MSLWGSCILDSQCSLAGVTQGVEHVGKVLRDHIPAPWAPWAQLGLGQQHLDLGWLSLAQIPTSGKRDLRSCFRETSKHVSTLMSSSSKIKPCSLATAEALNDYSIYFLFELYRLCWVREKCVVLQGRRNCWVCSRGITQSQQPQPCNSQYFIFLQENWSWFCYCSCQSILKQEPKSQLFSSNTGEEQTQRRRNGFILLAQNL